MRPSDGRIEYSLSCSSRCPICFDGSVDFSPSSVHTAAALRAGPFLATLQEYEQKWLKFGVTLLNSGFPNEAGEVFLRWYQFVREAEVAQVAQPTRFLKGTVLWWIGRSRQALRRDDEARNWFLLAMIEDVRTDASTWQNLPARDSLVNGQQMAAVVVDGLGREAARMCAASSWSPAEPESIWLALLPHKRRFTRAPLLFLKGLAASMAARLGSPGQTAKQKGDALEALITYLFAAERGFEVLGPSKAPDAQNDILVRNGHDDAAIAAVGDYLLVECKNWGKKVRAPTVREMAGRLQAAAVKTGVLVSSKGISGSTPRTKRSGACLAISKEYLQDRTAILVLSQKEIHELVAGNESLASLLLLAFEDVRFDRV